ncbi:MAG: fumarylacetoacetate hydrolase family protein [Chloroflexota bacterium]
MRFVRYSIANEIPRWGWVFEDYVGPIDGDFYNDYRRLPAEMPLDAVKLMPPVLPTKIICVGRNYVDHAKEHGVDVPEIPLIFLKPPSSLIGNEHTILLPPQSVQVEHEAELAVIFGRRGRWISADEAGKYILGYTIANDVTARDLQRQDGQWTRGKGFDTFCPMGPWIETELDPYDLLIVCRVNGEVRQMASTRDMVFSIPQLIAFASSVMTLEAGDVLLTGTPAGVGRLEHGDRVEITIEGIGGLTNPVEKEIRPG